MNWYQGSISEAVVKAKTKGAIFVVYIEGKDEKSAQLTRLIDDKQVVDKLHGNDFVSIKLEASTLPHQQFCEIYKETPIPSIYFIGKQGTPLEIVKDCDNVEHLCTSIDNVLRKAGLSIDKSSSTQSGNFVDIEKSSTVVCDNGVCTIKKNEETSSPSTSKSDDDDEKTEEIQGENQIEEKVERAKQLIEMKREEKRKQEEEEERLKEVERRKVGKNVTELKRWQNEQELKQLYEEREREKRENQQARQRILEQIAQDKAERAAKFSNATTATSTITSPSSSSSKSTTNSSIVRLQFRIPDGKSIIQDFQIDNTLNDVHEFIQNNIKLPFNKYILSTTFPRREFTNLDENKKTLLELELAPSAVLLILPIGSTGGGTNGNTSGPLASIRNLDINNLFWSLILPFVNIFNYLKGLIFTGTGNDNNVDNESNNQRKTTDDDNISRFKLNRRGGGNNSSTAIRRQGNIHRLSNRNNDSDDENNTWNGNSTQQM